VDERAIFVWSKLPMGEFRMELKTAVITIGVLGIAAAPWAAMPSQANIVYAIDQTSTTPEVSGELSPLSDTVTGTITTDGTIGALQASDVVSWNLQLTDNLHPYSVDLTPTNSGVVPGSGAGLVASASGLSFDFSESGALFAIQGTTHGFFSGYQYLCFQATSGPCVAGETIVPDYYSVDGVSATGLSGTRPLNVPEPATWALMALGFAGLGFAGCCASRKTALAG
jgi:hypothetical protein